ncbi:MAG TPA: inositol monophosphatase family protein, partial [Thermohalobaculum sp.]|nr:inositol monophosphatase family protein [Thermohalobaculum sp.]
MNDRRMRVSGRRELTTMLFATGIPFGDKETLPATLRDLAKLMPRTAGVRRMGAAALDLAYVAAGRYDGFWERELEPWDIAAGLLLVREAGGLVGPLGSGDPLESGSLVVANGEIFETFSKLLAES